MSENWYQKAQKSNNEDVKNLVYQYNSLDAGDPKRKELKEAIKIIVGDDEVITNPFEVVEDVQDVTESREETKEEAETEFSLTEKHVNKISDVAELHAIIAECRDEIKRIDGTRLKKETFHQKIEKNREIWKVRRIEYLARSKIYEQKRKEKELENKNKVSQIATKRARFVMLFKKGISFSNICTHPDGVRKDEILDIVNDDVIKSCKEVDKYFMERWDRWVKKYFPL